MWLVRQPWERKKDNSIGPSERSHIFWGRAASQNIAGFQRQQPPAEIFTRETAELGANGTNSWLQKPRHEIPFQHPLSRLVSLLGGRWGQSVCKSRPGRLEARLPFLLLRYLDSKWILSFPGCWLTRQWQMARGEFGSTK